MLEAEVKNEQIEKLLVVWVILILRNVCLHCSWSMSSCNSQLLPLLLKSQVPCIFASLRVSNITAMLSIYLLRTEHPIQRKRKANKVRPNNRYKSTILLQPTHCITSDIIFTTHFNVDVLQEILSVLFINSDHSKIITMMILKILAYEFSNSWRECFSLRLQKVIPQALWRFTSTFWKYCLSLKQLK